MHLLSSSAPRTAVQRMVNPQPYDNSPIEPLPPLPWPRGRRVKPTPTPTTQSDPLPIPATPPSAPRLSQSSPIPFPPLYTTLNDEDDVETLPEILTPHLQRTVNFRDTPLVHVYEVDQTERSPVPLGAPDMSPGRGHRIRQVRRPLAGLHAPRKKGKCLLSLIGWAACFTILLAALTYMSRAPPRPDLRPQLPPEFYFTHRDFRRLIPIEVAPYGYMIKAASSALAQLDEVIYLNKEASRHDWIRPQRKRDWLNLMRQVDVVRLDWLKVLSKVNATERELGIRTAEWKGAMDHFEAQKHPAVVEYLSKEQKLTQDPRGQYLRQYADISSKAIDNYARSTTLSLVSAEAKAGLYLPRGAEPWREILLGKMFDEERPRGLSKVPNFFVPLVPSFMSKWLDSKRRRMQLSASLAKHVSYFEAYTQIVTTSIEHLKNSSRVVEGLVVATKEEGELASIGDISQAWDNIAGGISTLIEERFRFGLPVYQR